MPDYLQPIYKGFADDKSLFSSIKDIVTSNTDITNDLVKIRHWKMLFNPNINKQATEVYFFQRCEKSYLIKK